MTKPNADKVAVDSSVFVQNLSASDSDVQKALETLDGLTTNPDLSGYVPYTGATNDVDLGANSLESSSLTASPTGNNDGIVANGSGSGDGINITHSGSGVKLNIGSGGSGDAIRFDTDKFLVDDSGNISSSLFDASRILSTNSSKQLTTLNTATYPSLSEFAYVKGVTSSIQTQLDAKFTLPSLTSGSALFSNGTTIAQDNQGYYYNDTNNRLSVFTTLGNEVLSNPNFTGSATGWTVGSGWAYSSNAVNKSSNGTATLTQNVSIYVLREYLLTYTISNWTVGSVTPTVGGHTGTAVSANGTYTERFVASSSVALTFTPTNTARFTIDTISLKPLTGNNTKSNINTGGLSVEGAWSNGTPGTTRAQTFNNDGTQTWTDYRFAGVLRGAFGVDSSGGINSYSSGGNYFAYYSGNSGLTSTQLFSYNYPTAFVHYAEGRFGGKVQAGANSAPTSTLQSAGGLALKVKRITTSQTLDDTATHWIADASTAVCTGTPSAACSSWNNQSDCEKWDAHGGCTWNAGSSCSAFNGDQSSCEGQSGCTYDTADCSGVGAYDQSSCEAYSGCSWSYSSEDCSSLDEGSCSMTSGCSVNYDYCYNYSDGGGDGTACSSVSGYGCSYDSGSGSCSDGIGDSGWYSGCSGSYDSYSCTGSYYTGNCSGSYGSGCSGTSTCGGIDDSTNCGNETGCSWVTALNVTLPSIASFPDRTYWIYNGSSSDADINIVPSGTDTVNHTTSVVLSTYKDGCHLAPLRVTADCASFNEGACTPSGCTKNYSYCSYDTMENTCSGNAVCPSHDGNQFACEAQDYFSGCSGTYLVSSNWYVWSRT
jgi:hypothetical protein